jgi:hypothetical protein
MKFGKSKEKKSVELIERLKLEEGRSCIQYVGDSCYSAELKIASNYHHWDF